MDFKYDNIRGNYLPLVPIEMKGVEWIEFRAFVDTGATRPLFTVSTASTLDIDVEKGKKTEAMVADGSFIPIYLHKILVRFCGKEFDALIGFSKRLGAEFNILGRKDIFDRFVFCFDDYNKVLNVNETNK